LSPLFERVGFPSSFSWSDAFLGRYSATPAGVHLDGACNFTFGIAGKKTLHLWEPEYYLAIKKRTGQFDYRKHLKNATSLTVGPGEALYFPSRLWHVAEPGDDFSETATIALYGRYSIEEAAWQFLSRVVKRYFKEETRKARPSKRAHRLKTFPAGNRNSDVMALPSELEQVISKFDRSLNRGNLHRILTEEWQKGIKDWGFSWDSRE
jgi:hypothetical protein